MRLIIVASFLLCFRLSFAQEINIIPQPVEIKMGEGNFQLSSTTRIRITNNYYKPFAEYLRNYIVEFTGINCQIETIGQYGFFDSINRKNVIRINIPPKVSMERWIENGKYILEVNSNSIRIDAIKGEGLFYGIQTLIQLLPIQNQKFKTKNIQLLIPQLTITDYPRFEYRGMHLDVSRHFSPVSFVKKYIDYLALHKLNIFHWHLTDDQGWRIEIKKYPKLTSVGGWRNGTIIDRYPGKGNDNLRHGGYYTQEEIKEVVRYATERFITVVPEIELPGHASAAIAAYPELSCFPNEPTIKYFPKDCTWSGDSSGKQVQQTWGVFDDVFCAGQEKTFEFLQNVLDEVLPLFPSKLIHVGGDECPKENWKRCATCQQRIKDNKLKDEHELQSYFIQRMEKYLNKQGRTLIGWDEILEGGLAPNAVVMSWRGEAGGIEAAKQKHKVIMTPGNPLYFDFSQSENEDSITIGGYNPIEKVYAYEPIPKELTTEDGQYIMGAQANLWAEYLKNPKKVEYMLFPRLAALSEVLWSTKENRNWENFEKRLQEQFKRYQHWKVNYSKAYFDLKATILPADDSKGILWKIETKQPGVQIKYITHYAGRPYELSFAEGTTYTSPIEIKSTMLVAAISQLNGKAVSNPVYQSFNFNKATGKKITLINQPSKSYPGDGAFTLVNGVQNEKGTAKSKEFLGFSGDDCIATIDLGKEESISFVKVHYLHQTGSWIYKPSSVIIFTSTDGIDFTPVALSNPTIANNEAICEFLKPANARFVKIQVVNFGIIPAGNPGAGSKAWLFVDEIEVN